MKLKLQPPGGMLTPASVALMLAGLTVVVRECVTGPTWAIGLGLLTMVFGAGIWFRRSWGRWGTLAMFGYFMGRNVLQLMTNGLDWLPALSLLGTAAASAYFWKLDLTPPATESVEPDDPPMISLVLLLAEPRFLDAAIVARLASIAWNTEVVADSDDEEMHDPEYRYFVVGDSPFMLIRTPDAVFMVHNLDVPYFDDVEEAAAEVPELRIRKALLEHRAWLSVDFYSNDQSDARVAEAYRSIGRLLAELADEDCLAIICPGTGNCVAYDSQLEEQLRSEDPLTGLLRASPPPVLQIDGDDPRMVAAVAEARRRWPEFVSAFEQRRPDQNFAVKSAFCDGQNTEFMWLTVTATEGEVIYGVLDNEPVDVHNVALGDRVRVHVKDLNDWVYTNAGQMHGGFTVKVFEKLEEGES